MMFTVRNCNSFIARVGRPLLALALLAGCQNQLHQVRAIWVTRYEYETADHVAEIMENCEAAGFNTVLFQVRGNGTAFYRSSIEPWAEELGGEDPGFDPLAVAIAEARARDMELHAWVNVMPAWRGPDEPKNPHQLYHEHPEWFWYDADGVRQPLVHTVGERTRAWYVSLNPCLPAVRRYLLAVFEEIVKNYEVDGLHLDYIRFPNERVVPGEKIPDYPRDEATLALFREATGKTPDDEPDAWNQWRTDAVTRLVSDIHAMVHETRPGAVLSAAVGTNRAAGLRHHRDADTWVARGIVDVVFPMNYQRDLATYRQGLVRWAPSDGKRGPAVRVVPGLWFDRRLSTDEGIRVTEEQIAVSIEATGHFCLFAYHLLFGSPRNDRLAPADRARVRKQCEQRRRGLLPYLRRLRDGRRSVGW